MSEPQLIGEILPAVMRDIENRCRQNPHNKAFNKKDHRDRVLSAVGEFVSSKPNKRRKIRRKPKANALF